MSKTPLLHPERGPSPSAVSAGRGLVYITFAKLWFMVGGYAIAFALPHLLDQARVGEWALILSWVSVLNNVMVTATIQGVSKFSSLGSDAVEGVKRAALRIQLGVGGGIAVAFFLAAPLIADFEHDAGLIPGLRVVATVIFSYALYAVFVGAANGAREFHKQAGLDITYTTLRASLVIGGAVALHSVMGSVVGFAVAAALILGLSVLVVGFRPVEKAASTPDLARFMIGVGGYLLVVNILMFVDGWLIKRLVSEAAAATGMTALQAATYASERVGMYAQAQTFARMPYQLILAVTFVLFPLVSRSTFEGDREQTRRYVDRSLRWSLIAVGAMATAMAARPEALVGLMGKKYLPGAVALPPLALGYVAFSLMSIAGTIINGAGRTLPTTVIGLVTLAVDAGGNWAALHFASAGGHDPLLAAGMATATAMVLGAVLSGIYLRREFGASLRLSSALRVAIAAAAGVAVGRLVPLSGVRALAACVAAGLVYVVVLFISREITAVELRALRKRT
ncbi:MAG: hypothetical protein EXR72_02395 [Myxococcales bacterium]|nr:hypothetical protein [Myxococcales bacterium]